jgi:DNA mismatch repair protein MutS
MAQSGMFVPAEKCVYSPYNSIFTRITGNDNLFKGLSSFTLEMLELKAILKRAGPHTLVIGDEVCRGTEHISGNAIVASTIINLAKLQSSFIFATHLHEVAEMERIKEIKTIKPYHLSVTYDTKTDTLIYDRQLKEGLGESIYGITVAKYIINDNNFINMALEIKNELLQDYGSLVSGKKSKYNSEIYIHECQMCHKKDIKGFISNLQTHHINFQKNCSNGLVDGKQHIRKNDKANLIILCTECHDRVHHKGLNIEGTILTSKGRQIKISESEIIKKNSDTDNSLSIGVDKLEIKKQINKNRKINKKS